MAGSTGFDRAGVQAVPDEQLLATYVDETRHAGEREAAFRELVRRYTRRVFAVCFRVLGSSGDAEDAVQETFVKLALNAESFRGDAKLSTWLYRVARNVCTDRIRYEARRPATPVDDPATAAPEAMSEDHAAGRVTAITLEHALGQLDERSRTLLLLVAVDGLSYAEAAEVAELPVGTVKSRVSRARLQLGRILEDADERTPNAQPRAERNPSGGGAVSPGPTRGPPDAPPDPAEA